MSAAEVVAPDEVYPPQDAQATQSNSSELVPVQSQSAAVKGVKGFRKGMSGNPGGRPKKLQAIEKMLNEEHRNIDKMRETFARLRSLAMGEAIIVPYVNEQGEFALKCELKADARFMQLYLDRLLGPAKAFEDSVDFSSAPDDVLEWLAKYFGKK